MKGGDAFTRLNLILGLALAVWAMAWGAVWLSLICAFIAGAAAERISA